MNNTILLLLCSSIFFACQESLEERCAREAKEYTEKKCPAPIGTNMVIDSMTFDRSTHTLHYFYTLNCDTARQANINRQYAYNMLLEQIKNATSIKEYKAAGFNFAYTYYSSNDKNKKLLELKFSKKDYE